jgi:hypothetical protein
VKNIGLILAAILMGGVALAAPSSAKDRSYDLRYAYSQRALVNQEPRHSPTPSIEEFRYSVNGG